uniref:Uncharacterized protein n=1 Tax=Plectus sambesii TaxID=2011161 RepID=A0A914WU95_9BILA
MSRSTAPRVSVSYFGVREMTGFGGSCADREVSTTPGRTRRQKFRQKAAEAGGKRSPPIGGVIRRRPDRSLARLTIGQRIACARERVRQDHPVVRHGYKPILLLAAPDGDESALRRRAGGQSIGRRLGAPH